ncbi:MAG TPA: hypothetical protein VIY72_16865 [Acidimicrobiales bacterium]
MADSVDVELLHIKGAALDPTLADPRRAGTDADVLVRPHHIPTFVRTLQRHGWQVHSRFETGSPFGHAVTLAHPTWGYADVHRRFPGITRPDDEAFDRLWRDRGSRTISGVDCDVPGLVAQRLILVLNSARGASHRTADLDAAWTSASTSERGEVRALVGALGAEVAFAAGIGELEHYRGRRDYDLWRITAEGGASRTAEWLARLRAAPSTRARLRLALRAPLVNTDHLAVQLRRTPNRREVARAFLRRVRRAGDEVWSATRACGSRDHR